MNLLNPAYLWTLLALIPLGLVYLMKTKPRKRVTNALFLWKKVLEDKSSHFAIKKLRNLWSLLLMLLLFLLAALSLTNPFFGEKQHKQDYIIVLDSSVSMRALENGESRFDLAKEKIHSWLKSIDGGNRIALATVDQNIHYQCSLTSNTHELKQALSELSPSELPLSPSAFSELSMLTQQGENKNHCQILFLTDMAHDTEALPSGINAIPVSDSLQPNYGIIAADIAPLPNNRSKLFFTVQSTSEEQQELEIELSHHDTGRIAKLVTITLKPRAHTTEVIELEGLEEGLWSLTLLGEDAFLEDNRVMLGYNQPEAIGVAIDVQKPYFYSRCIQAFEAADNLLEITSADEAKLLITEGVVPASNALVFAPSGESPSWDITARELEQIIPTAVIKNHPSIQHLNIDNISFSGAIELTAPPSAIVILEDISGTPLLYEHKHDGKSTLVANFQPEHDNFYLSPWFPILVHNAATYLAGRDSHLPALTQSGSTVSIPSLSDTIEQQYVSIGSEKAISQSVPLKHQLKQLGGYTYSSDNGSWHTGAAILSAEESSIPETSLTELTSNQPASGWPLAWWLLLAAAIVGLLEEALYQRRKVG
ncbi:VWA domain-containing protein [Rubritalea sp.]|uniref:VWA domain-containing protein n=1 Tax=Rubritalea sp. TaxID=2109375 RepID=UPI003EF5B8FB